MLAALLFFTLATSGAAWAETTIAAYFHVEIPQWINAAVALSIAVIKTTIVVMFFMQLKYDNPMNTVIFVFTILTVFSFLGLGAQPPTPEWGLMLSEGRRYIRDAWWNSMFPGVAIMLTVLAINLLGDGLRDALDPRLK